jgi:hypothetical protein
MNSSSTTVIGSSSILLAVDHGIGEQVLLQQSRPLVGMH